MEEWLNDEATLDDEALVQSEDDALVRSGRYQSEGTPSMGNTRDQQVRVLL
jgi:hypothetical protein